jgi:hypothetical protein
MMAAFQGRENAHQFNLSRVDCLSSCRKRCGKARARVDRVMTIGIVRNRRASIAGRSMSLRELLFVGTARSPGRRRSPLPRGRLQGHRVERDLSRSRPVNGTVEVVQPSANHISILERDDT